MPAPEQTLAKLTDQAIGVLSEFLTSDDVDTKQIGRARVAASVLSNYTRLQQVHGAREATTFMMARELANDRETLEKYVRAAMPNSPMVRALPVPVATPLERAG